MILSKESIGFQYDFCHFPPPSPTSLAEIEFLIVNIFSRNAQPPKFFRKSLHHAERSAHINIPLTHVTRIFGDFIHGERTILDGKAHKRPEAGIVFRGNLDFIEEQGFLAGTHGVIEIHFAVDVSITDKR